MTIEFFTPHGEVPEYIITFIKEKLMVFYHRNPAIDEAKVVLRRQHINVGIDHVCEITLDLCGESLMIHRSGDCYLQAAREVINEIATQVDSSDGRRNDLPENLVTTVTV
jgi:ribosome-associated translation inhibitor RaiA